MVKLSTFSCFSSSIKCFAEVFREFALRIVGACSFNAIISFSQLVPNSFSKVAANHSGIECSKALLGTVPFFNLVKISAILIPSNSSNFL